MAARATPAEGDDAVGGEVDAAGPARRCCSLAEAARRLTPEKKADLELPPSSASPRPLVEATDADASGPAAAADATTTTGREGADLAARRCEARATGEADVIEGDDDWMGPPAPAAASDDGCVKEPLSRRTRLAAAEARCIVWRFVLAVDVTG